MISACLQQFARQFVVAQFLVINFQLLFQRLAPGRADDIAGDDCGVGWRFGGRRFDIGDKLGFVKTNLEFALRDPALAADLRKYLATLL